MNVRRRITNLERRWPGRDWLEKLQRKPILEWTDGQLERFVAEVEAAAGRKCSLPLSDADLERIAGSGLDV
jgi:hypothetical protein